jgi:hypothetical protein
MRPLNSCSEEGNNFDFVLFFGIQCNEARLHSEMCCLIKLILENLRQKLNLKKLKILKAVEVRVTNMEKNNIIHST